MSSLQLGRLIRQMARREAGDLLASAVLGTITVSGLQLDDFKHPIRDWWADQGVTLPVGTRVVAFPLSGGTHYYVRGPVVRQEVTG